MIQSIKLQTISVQSATHKFMSGYKLEVYRNLPIYAFWALASLYHVPNFARKIENPATLFSPNRLPKHNSFLKARVKGTFLQILYVQHVMNDEILK